MTTIREQEPRWYLYRFNTRLSCAVPHCRLPHKLYIGKTNEPWRRVLEHAKTKGWFAAACGYEIDERTYATEAECLAAEKAAILAELPLANEQHNGGNPHRLFFDGPPAALPVARRSARTEPRPTRSRRLPRLSLRWRRRRNVVAVRSTLWLGLSLLAWWAAVRYLHAAAGHVAAPVALAVTALMVLTVPTWRSRRSGWRRGTCLVLAAVPAFAALWLLGHSVLPHAGHVPAALIPTVPARK